MATRQDAAELSQLFTRKASGLVRVATGLDTFIFSIGLISVGAGIFTGLYFRANYPGADFVTATAISGVGSVFVALCFYFFSVVFPRSGGTFVFVSRTAGAALAFPLTFFEVIAFSFLGAVNSYFIVQVGLAPFFSMLSFLTGSAQLGSVATWLGTQTGTFLIGLLVLIITGAVPVFGMRKLLLLNRVMFALAMIGILLGLIVLLTTTSADFLQKFTSATGLKPADVINAAVKSGYGANAPFSWDQTLKLTAWPSGYLAFAVMSSAIGGEIKSVRRSQFVGMVGAVVAATIMIIIYIPLADNVFGRQLMDALAWNSTNAPTFSTSAPPYITLLLGIASPNVVVGGLIIFGFIAWLYFLISPQLVYAQRLLIAWSFDRMAPERLGYVNERFHSPIVAIILTVVVAAVFVALISYGVLPVLAYILGIFAVWTIVCVLGAIFPWVRPAMFKNSPIFRYKVAGVPAITLVSIPAAAFLIWQTYLYWQDPLVAGHSTPTVIGHIIGFGAGILSYIAIRAVRSSQGIDLGKVFNELPIE